MGAVGVHNERGLHLNASHAGTVRHRSAVFEAPRLLTRPNNRVIISLSALGNPC